MDCRMLNFMCFEEYVLCEMKKLKGHNQWSNKNVVTMNTHIYVEWNVLP